VFKKLFISKSIPARFGVSFISAILRSGLAFVTAMLLARWLGPDEYGRVVFLLAAHIAIRQFIDMGTSSAFFTFISKRERSHCFVLIYWGWLLFQLFTLGLITYALLPTEILGKLFSGESRNLVLLALLSSFLQGVVWQTAAQMGEAIRETAWVQTIGIIALAIHLLLLTLAWSFDVLSIPLIFFLASLEWLIASVFIYILHYRKANYAAMSPTDNETIFSIFEEYKTFCLPLIPLAWLGAMHDFFDRWMLQTWSGSKEQAYFGVASQISAISLLVTTAILRIFWKEMSAIHEAKDYERMGELSKIISKSLFIAGAFLTGAMLPWAQEILFFTAGEGYLDGRLTFAIMLVYPIHQSLGQITNTTYYATSNTKLLLWVNGTFLLVGIFVTYLALAPRDALIPGFNMSSPGLAAKLVLMQVIFVNCASYILARKYNWQFEWAYQLLIPILCIGIGFLLKFFVISSLDWLPSLVLMILFAVFYGGTIFSVFKNRPYLIGFSLSDFPKLIK
jgi:O-antigen/teichoic acid export membrane protein